MCAWQYVYGTNPAGEADLGAEAVANGADCLVIDAEAEYEGHYAAAQTYIDDLRAKIGADYPARARLLPLRQLPPVLPLLGLPRPGRRPVQRAADVLEGHRPSVDTVYANTYIANRIYGRPIFPLGQTYGGVSSSRTAALPRGGRRLRRHRALLLGLAGNARRRLDARSPRRWRR